MSGLPHLLGLTLSAVPRVPAWKSQHCVGYQETSQLPVLLLGVSCFPAEICEPGARKMLLLMVHLPTCMKVESDRTGMEASTCQEFLGMATAHTCEAFGGVFESVASEATNPTSVYSGRVKK